MEPLMIIGILIAMLLLLGGLLYLAAQFVIKKVDTSGSGNARFQNRKKKLWIWRSFIIVLLIYSLFLLFANKAYFAAKFGGPFKIFFEIILVIYFTALIEIVVIDLLLPDVVQMWQRLLVEVIVFVLLCTLTVFTFNFSLLFISALV